MSERKKVSQFERFRIQMAVLVPLARRLREELGTERADALLAEVLDGIARRQGERTVAGGGPVTLETMEHSLAAFAADGALTYEVVERSETRLGFDVTGCRYAEHLDRIGGRDLGPLLVCRGDFPAAEGMGIELTRTETVMTGGRRCNFRYRWEPAR